MGRLRFLTAGESHGEMLVGILEGMPAGLSLIAERDIDPVLRDRQRGYGRGHRQKIEQDRARIVSGVRFGLTTGAPITLIIENKDHAHWRERMSVTPTSEPQPAVTIPRPGHADLAGAIKYGQESDLRNILERASARETAMRVAIGAVAATLLNALEIELVSYVRAIGSVEAMAPANAFGARLALMASELRVSDASAETAMKSLIDKAKAEGDTLGGTVECIARGLPPGLGSHAQWDRKLDGLIAQAMMSIQAVKAVEIGAGFEAARRMGSATHDAISIEGGLLRRASNNAGGIEGGMSNGEPVVVRLAMKPISTLMRPLNSVDLATGQPVEAHIERSDVCAVPSLAVIAEHTLAFVLAAELLETFAGDSMSELRDRVSQRRGALRLPRTV